MSLKEDKYHLTMQVPQINSLQDFQASEDCYQQSGGKEATSVAQGIKET